MSRKYKTLNLVVEDFEEKGLNGNFRVARVLQILRKGPDGAMRENFWWLLMKETIKTAYRNRDKKLFDEARKILDDFLFKSYYPNS